MRLEEGRKGLKILADDGCPSAFGWVRNGMVTIASLHNEEWHVLVLQPEDLERLAKSARECKIEVDQ